MHINDFPREILVEILEFAALKNEAEGVTYSFGLSQATSTSQQKPATQKYVNGRLPHDHLRWDAVHSIRQVCRVWHEWSLDYAIKDLYIRRWRGSERWANLPQRGGEPRACLGI